MSRQNRYVINFMEENEQPTSIDISRYVISEFAEFMMDEISRTHIVHNSNTPRRVGPDVLSNIANGLFRQEIRQETKIPTFKSEVDLGECSICFDTMRKGQLISRLPCHNEVSHAFHKKCIKPWLESNKSCPNCRSEF